MDWGKVALLPPISTSAYFPPGPQFLHPWSGLSNFYCQGCCEDHGIMEKGKVVLMPAGVERPVEALKGFRDRHSG